MWNKKKIQGILLAVVGVFLARIDVFITLEKAQLFPVSAIGILLALTGTAVYAAGMPRTVKRVKTCSSCLKKNYVEATFCEKCKKPLLKKQ
jgi:drug/metabolite transporter (DMT)-like permease